MRTCWKTDKRDKGQEKAVDMYDGKKEREKNLGRNGQGKKSD